MAGQIGAGWLKGRVRGNLNLHRPRARVFLRRWLADKADVVAHHEQMERLFAADMLGFKQILRATFVS